MRFFFLQLLTDHENSMKHDSKDDVGVDINDDDLPMTGEIDSGDHDSNDMSRPRKIRRWEEFSIKKYFETSRFSFDKI